jgi:outer membrane lipoprotein-sorting protein
MTALIAFSVISTGFLTPTWQDIVQPAFKDCTFTAHAVRGNQKELRKINNDFATSYRFSFMKAKVKEPFMVRLESTVEDTDILYMENGARKLYRIPKIHLSKVEDVSNAPGKRQTVMDFGILTPSLFQSLFNATYVRTDRENGHYVFDLTYKHPRYDDTSKHRVWIDPQRKYITKRVWFSQEGRELATFIYEKPKFERGVWFPTRATVKNVEDKIAGITEYTSMNINVGLSSSIFQF